MFFGRNNKIDDDVFETRQSDKKNINLKLPLIILGCIIFLIIIILLISKLFNKKQIVYDDKLYYINLIGDREITLYVGDTFVEPGYTGTDDIGNDLTKEVVISDNIDNNTIGNYKVSYTLGNITKERNVKVIEKSQGATYIYLYGDVNVFLYVGDTYEEKGYEVIDTFEGSKLKDKVIVNSNVDTSHEGIYKIIYSVVNTSGITVSKERTVIVTDRNISLLPSITNITNSNVTINVYVKDELFDYLILPNNKKVTERISTYEVSSNGTYTFTMYNNNGDKTEKKITINNIDREVPSGSCSGSYSNGISNINIKANDNNGISRYILNGTTYTTNNIKVNEELKNVTITIYDKAGNSKDISCNLEGKSVPASSSTPKSSNYNVDNVTVEMLLTKDLCDKVYDITADDLNRLFISWSKRTGNTNSPLLETGDAWIKACEETGLDPLTLVGISGEETGRGGFNGMAWMEKKNFFGMRYIDPSGDGTGRSVKWAGVNDVFNGDVYAAVLQSAKRIKNFYYTQHGGRTMLDLARTGYTGYRDEEHNYHYAYTWASIMKESLDYIVSLHK